MGIPSDKMCWAHDSSLPHLHHLLQPSSCCLFKQVPHLLSTSASQLHKQKPHRAVQCSLAEATSLARDCLFRNNTVPPPQSLSAQPQLQNAARNAEHVAAEFWH